MSLGLVAQRQSHEEAVADTSFQGKFRLGDGLPVVAVLQRARTQVGVYPGFLNPVPAVARRRERETVLLLITLTFTAAGRHQRERDMRRGQGARVAARSRLPQRSPGEILRGV